MKLFLFNFLFTIFGILCYSQTHAQFNSFGRRQASNCVTPNNFYGTCVAFSFCPEIANAINTVSRRYFDSLERACGYNAFNGESVICCRRPYSAQLISTTANPFLGVTTPGALQPTPDITNGNPFLIPTSSSIVLTPSTPTTTSTSRPTAAPLIDNEPPYCRDPKGDAGACISIRQCKSLLSELQSKPRDVTFKNYLQLSNVICNKRSEAVCCPLTDSKPTSKPTSAPVTQSNNNALVKRPPTIEEGCGLTKTSFKKIVGGENAPQGAWPWIALLGYDEPSTPFRCGGTLVSARHVVSAAHCIVQSLTFVRLGEHDLSTDAEAKHIDINVVKSVPHPQYNRRDGRGDIAILYLEKNVQFNDHITPICLPNSNELRTKSYVNHSPLIAGWGHTSENGSPSKILQQLQITVLSNAECEARFRSENRLISQQQFDSAIVCAGVLTGGKDSCKGDSGGPLMIPEVYKNNVRFYLLGVVSYGIGCARPGIPGVYSSVQYFMDWLLEKMAENP